MWLLFTLLSGLLYTGESLLIRQFMRVQKDAWAFSFFYSLVGTVISLPFMLAAPQVPHTADKWALAMLVGLIIVVHNLLVFKASGMLEASLLGALAKLRLVWIFVMGLLLLHEVFTWQKVSGTLLTIIAGIVIIHYFKRPRSISGVLLVVSATVLNAGIIILSKYLLGTFNAVSLTFFATFLPALLFNLLLMPRAIPRIRKLFRADWRPIVLICGLGSLANLALNQALSLHYASSVLVMSEAFLILILVGEHIFLKEKEYLWVKIVSTALAVLGAVLIQLSR